MSGIADEDIGWATSAAQHLCAPADRDAAVRLLSDAFRRVRIQARNAALAEDQQDLRVMMALVQAAGGKIIVRPYDAAAVVGGSLHRWPDPQSSGVVYAVKLRTSTQDTPDMRATNKGDQ